MSPSESDADAEDIVFGDDDARLRKVEAEKLAIDCPVQFQTLATARRRMTEPGEGHTLLPMSLIPL